MQINEKCRWYRFQKVGESQPRKNMQVQSIQNMLEK
jgi:hypothetical protein